MSIDADREPRRRRTAEAARAEALAAARDLLLRGGAEAVTLKAVAGEMGVSHANLIHRFGSAAGLHSALMAEIVEELGEAIRAAAARWLAEGGSPEALVDPVFRAFDEGGAGRLAARIALSDDPRDLQPVRDALASLTASLAALFPEAPDVRRAVSQTVLLVTLAAFGEAVLGGPMREMLDLDDQDARAGTRDAVAGWVARRVSERS